MSVFTLVKEVPERVNEISNLDVKVGFAEKGQVAALQVLFWCRKHILPHLFLFQDKDGQISKADFLSYAKVSSKDSSKIARTSHPCRRCFLSLNVK